MFYFPLLNLVIKCIMKDMQISLTNSQFIDERLEETGVWTLSACEERFWDKGGQIFIPGRFKIETGDALFPVCSAGVCRSQALYMLLKELIPPGQVELFPPHASRRGFDPYNGEVQIHREVVKYDAFEQVFGTRRHLQFGFEHRERWALTGYNAEEMKRYYDTHFFGKGSARRRVYIAFASPVHVVLKRLVEANSDLSDVCLVAIPLADEISNPPYPGMESGSAAAYIAFLNKIRPLFLLA